MAVVVLILEAGYFTARSIHARSAARRQVDLARRVEDALTRTSALVSRRPEAAVPEIVMEPSEEPAARPAAEEALLEAPPAPAETGETPPEPAIFPLTEPQRRLLEDLAVGRGAPWGGDRLGTEVMLEWLATLGFVQRGEGAANYVITPLGRRVLEASPQR